MTIQLHVIAPPRGSDPGGSGHFGAPRGTHLHMGFDIAVSPGSQVLSPVTGHVSVVKGYPYGDDLSYRYVEVTDGRSFRHRFFYVKTLLQAGQRVEKGDVLGVSQDVSQRYPIPRGMKPHVHYEIMDQNDNYVNPEEFWRE